MKMNINHEIQYALDVLYSSNLTAYSYWMMTLYDWDEKRIVSEWNEKNLKLIQDDVEVSTFCNV
jgi:hypothetical protein